MKIKDIALIDHTCTFQHKLTMRVAAFSVETINMILCHRTQFNENV